MTTAIFLLAFGLARLAVPAAGQEAQTVATVDGLPITAQELSNSDAVQMLPLRSQEYQVQANALEKLIRQRLLESAAKKSGVSSEAFLAGEVDRGVGQPTDAEVLAYYLAQSERNRRPFPAVKDQLRETLHRAQIQYAREGYLDRLRAQADVVDLLDPARADVIFDATRLKGDPNAPVMIVEFADFQCPYCRQQEGVLTKVLAKYGTQVALAYRDFPVTQLHPFADQAAAASRCAGEQGKYWQFHEILMAGKLDLSSLQQYAAKLNLDEKSFESCLAIGKFKGAVERDRQEAERLGITGTPTFFINGISMVGAETEENLSNTIEAELARHATKLTTR